MKEEQTGSLTVVDAVGPPIAIVTKKVYPVIEVFGPTLQGEGALAGLPSHFVRFGGCDFTCHWCDSAHAVLPENVRGAMKLTVTDIVYQVLKLPSGTATWVTLSGGNPVLHQLGNLVTALHREGFQVAVETQGSRWKDWLTQVDLLTVSPKPPSSRMVNGGLPDFIAAYKRTADDASTLCLKIPVYDEADLDFALEIHDQYDEYPFFLSIVTEMGGLYGDFADGRVDTAESLLARYQRVVQDVLRRGVTDARIIPQLHYLLWGNRTGV
jgi:7-carboxy-7-deazaguanine synthase